MNRHVYRLAVVLIAVVGVAACKVGKKPVRKQVNIEKNRINERFGNNSVDTPGTPVRDTPPPVLNERKKELAEVLTPLWKKQIQFNTFSGKAKMHIEAQGMKNEFTAHFRIEKDKMIWVNITALGGMANVARVLITPDSIFLINYLQKAVTKLPIEQANQFLPVPVDYITFQSLVVGDVISRKGKAIDASDFGGTLSLIVEDKSLVQNISYSKADSTMRVLQMRSKDEGGPAGMMQFGNYEKISDKMFAKSRVVNVNNNGEPYYLDMNFSNVSFDEELSFPFSIPESYTVK